MFDPTRPCSSTSKKKNRYTKDELLALSIKYQISLPYYNMTITELCHFFKTLNWKDLEKKRIEEKQKTKEWYRKKRLLLEEKKKKDMEIKKAKWIEMKMKKAKKEKQEKAKDLEKKKQQEKSKKNCIERSKKELRDYQKKVVRYLNFHDRLLVYHKMGTGKTLTAVTVSQCYLDKNPNRKVIVITPASLTDNFKKTMIQYGNIKNAERYEFYSIQKATRLLKQNQLSCKNNLVIIDEVHNYKGKIQFRKGILKSGVNIFEGYKCFLNAHKLLLLTGTPVYNNPDDMILYKVLLNYNINAMKDKSIVEIVKHYEKFDLDSIKCKVSYHDFSKNDKDFPERVDIVKKIKMSQKYEEQYKKILDEIQELKLNGGQTKLLGTVFKKLTEANKNQFENLTRRLTQNIDNDLDLNAKLRYVIKFIRKIKKENKDLSNNEKIKVIIYSQFKEHGIHLIMDQIKQMNIPFGSITGDTKISDRQKIVNDYNDGKLNVLFITKAAGEGLDLKGTDALFLMEPTWNENNSEQIIARAIRYKSHEDRDRKKVRIIHLIHTYSEDMKEPTQKRVEAYLQNTQNKVQSMPHFINGEDYKMLIYQNAKQKVLNYWDKTLQQVSIEKNKC